MALSNIDAIWMNLKLYVQTVTIIFLFEGYVISEYILQQPRNAVPAMPALWIPALISLMIGWHTRRMIRRAYTRFLEDIAVTVAIRRHLKIHGLGIYPRRWVEGWKLIESDSDGLEIGEFVEQQLGRRDTLYWQSVLLVMLMDALQVSIVVAISLYIYAITRNIII